MTLFIIGPLFILLGAIIGYYMYKNTGDKIELFGNEDNKVFPEDLKVDIDFPAAYDGHDREMNTTEIATPVKKRNRRSMSKKNTSNAETKRPARRVAKKD